MGLLKQGSKGKPVERLQTDLNRLGAKPKLKVDGIFGPLTKAAVQAFQKKAKMKADGAVGNLTEAAILMGGPLPEMTVTDGRILQKAAKAEQKNNAAYVNLMDKIMVEGIMLRKAVEGHRELGKKAVEKNKGYWVALFDVLTKLTKKQAQFDSLLLIAPKTAAKLVPQCEQLEREAEALVAQMMSAYKDISKDIDDVVSELSSRSKTITDHAGKLNKLVSDPLK